MEEHNATYRARPTTLSLLGALLIILIGGVLTGLATAVIGSFFYIVLVFPLGMGIAGGKIVSVAVRVAKFKSAGQLLLVSVLTALVIYGSFHYSRYVALQVRMTLELAPSMGEYSTTEKLEIGKIFVDAALKEETGYPGFLGYMLYKAGSGISIGRFYSQNRLNLTSLLAWLYWILEFGIILWITRSMGKKEMQVPVCENCGRRYRKEKHLGGTTPANEPLLLDLLKRNEMIELGQLIVKDAGLPSVELYMQRCEACGKSTAYILVRRASLGVKGYVQLSDVSKTTLRPQDSALFLQQLSFETN